MGRVIRSVSFNLNDTYERQLYEHICLQSKYFSKHVKLLIDRDKSGGKVQEVIVEEEKPMKPTTKSMIKGFL